MKLSIDNQRFAILRSMSRWVVCGVAALFAACSVDPAERPEPQIQTEAATRATVGEDGHTYEVVTVGKTELVLVDGTTYMMADDIVLSPEQVEFLRQEGMTAEEKTPTRGAAISEFVKYWPGGIVFYTIQGAFVNPQRISEAITEYDTKTDILFVPRTNEPNYVRFVSVNGSTSQSHLGMQGGLQEIKISNGASVGRVMHEIGHTLGLFHEHQRSDRDKYMDVHWGNIKSGAEKWYNIEPKAIMIGEFDIRSIMIYDSWANSNGGGPVMTRKNTGYSWVMNSALTTGDVEALRIMYDPDPTPVYPKLVSQYNAAESWHEMYSYSYERWHTVYDNWIEFYSDPQRTNRIALPDALRVFEIVRVENSNGVGPYQKLYISPGTWQYTLHDSVEDAEFSYGDTTYFTYLSYRNLRIVSDNI